MNEEKRKKRKEKKNGDFGGVIHKREEQEKGFRCRGADQRALMGGSKSCLPRAFVKLVALCRHQKQAKFIHHPFKKFIF